MILAMAREPDRQSVQLSCGSVASLSHHRHLLPMGAKGCAATECGLCIQRLNNWNVPTGSEFVANLSDWVCLGAFAPMNG